MSVLNLPSRGEHDWHLKINPILQDLSNRADVTQAGLDALTSSNRLHYVGTWNPSTNSPSLTDGTGTTGDFYEVSVAGTRNLGSGSITFAVGDFVLYDGTVWARVAGPATDLTQVHGAENNLQIVRGIINTAGSGSIVKGSGFSLLRTNTGDVTVTFTTPFSDVPSVTFGALGGGGAVGPIVSHRAGIARSASSFRVEVVSIGSGYADGTFDFIAVGPR